MFMSRYLVTVQASDLHHYRGGGGPFILTTIHINTFQYGHP